MGPLDELARRFGRLRARLVERGYTPTRVSRELLFEDRARAFPVSLPTDRCTTWIALGGGAIRDLALIVYDVDGAPLVRSSGRGEGALVHVCPPDGPERHYLELRAREGAGAVVLAAFASGVGEGEGFEGLFDELVAPTVPFAGVEAALAADRQALRDRGLRAEGPPQYRPMGEGQGWRLPVRLVQGHCYVFVARGGEGLEDVDLYLHVAGAEVGRDLGPDAAPRVEYCPAEDAEGTLEVRAFAGAGAVGVAVYVGTRPDDGPPPPRVERSTAEEDAADGLRRELERLRAQAFHSPIFLVQDATVRPSEVRVHDVTLGPGCGVVVAAGTPSELDLDLYLLDAQDEATVRDRDVRVRRGGFVAACPNEVRAFRVLVKAYGEGHYALATLLGEFPSLAALRLAASGLLDGTPLDEQWVEVVEGERATIAVPHADCLRVVAAGDHGVLDVDLLLRSGDRLLSSDTGAAPWASLDRCPLEPNLGPLELDVVGYRGEGRVILRWFGPRADDTERARPGQMGGP
ncbi:MAG: hypothetical protein KF901_21385 [Myxococcales bacterium]|nr:hypothetical protein [Myxococcales bacterium]